MRKVVVYELMSLDGVAEDPDAFFTDWDAAMDANLAEVIATQDTVVLGRRSYDEWSRFWPTSGIQPFAAFINAVEKVVATSTPLDPVWSAASAMAGDPVDVVGELKGRDGGDIGVHASISLAQTLLAAGLVDELRLVVAPTIAGAGRRLLDGVRPTRLAPTRSAVSPSGFLMLDYRVIG